jgi:Integrase zinc binding domain
LLTDHKPLVFALHWLSDPWTARQQRHLSFIAEYTTDVRHMAGKENVVADALSRPATVVAVPAADQLDFAVIAEQQLLCEDTLSVDSNDKLDVKSVNVQGQEVLFDMSTGAIRPLVPEMLRKTVFRAIHDILHPGTGATCWMINARYEWHGGSSSNVTRWCKECMECAHGKIQQHAKTQVEPIPVPQEKFQHVSVDIVLPLPMCRSWGCGGSFGDVVAQGGCGCSLGMWWLSLGMWWLSWLKHDWVNQTATQQFRVRYRLPPQSPEGRQEL